MSRIPPVKHIPFPGDEQPAPPGAQASTGISATSSMSLLFRTMAHRPELARLSMALLEEAMRGGTVEPQLKELVAVRVSQVNHCYY
jgi:alkylhydroperoxidase family enzyme